MNSNLRKQLHKPRVHWFLKWFTWTVLTAIVIGMVSPVFAMPVKDVMGPSDPTELASFINGYLSAKMTEHHVAGAVVSVVKDGQIMFANGYGYANVAQQIPVDPETTLFRIASVSKVFTWTAVMQLVEQGKLDLNADVNTYLDFAIPGTFPEPITLNHLMAHTAGFEDRMAEQLADDVENVVPSAAWLQMHIPARVRPPGKFSAYSNYGVALAGYMVERVSGMKYEDYIEQNILIPLKMTHSTAHQPIPGALASNLSEGYIFEDGQYRPEDFEAFNVAPAGVISASGTDMAHFMIAHLQNGTYDGATILQPATAKWMHTRHFAYDPRINGWAHGFMAINANGEIGIAHAGDTLLFHSMMVLFPEHDLGFFISTNSANGSEIAIQFALAFIEHYFPQDLPALPPPSADFAKQAEHFTGNYRMNRMSYTTAQKILMLFTTLDIRADSGGLIIGTPFGEQYFVQVEPLVFRQSDDDTLLIFREDSQGQVSHAFYGLMPDVALEKNQWYETPSFNLALLMICLILFLTVLIGLPIQFYIRRTYTAHQPASKLGAFARAWSTFVAIAGILIPILVFAFLQDFKSLLIGNESGWAVIQTISFLFVILGLGMIVFTLMAWTKRLWSLAGRIQYTLVTLGSMGYIWFLYFWNFLGKGF